MLIGISFAVSTTGCSPGPYWDYYDYESAYYHKPKHKKHKHKKYKKYKKYKKHHHHHHDDDDDWKSAVQVHVKKDCVIIELHPKSRQQTFGVQFT